MAVKTPAMTVAKSYLIGLQVFMNFSGVSYFFPFQSSPIQSIF